MRPAKNALCLVLLCLPVWACGPTKTDVLVPAVPDTTSCGAGTVANYIGQPASILPAAGPWTAVRIIRPGAGVTMDFSATRLNVNVGSTGRILSLTCG